MNTNCVSKILTVIAVAAAAAVATPTASAAPIYFLTLTEVSDTVLTYTYSNLSDPMPFTVVPVTKDIWNITINPSSGIVVNDHEFLFAEGAAEPNKVNFVLSFASSNSLTVNSDQPLEMGDVIVISANIGTDDGFPIIVQFVDSAFASEAASNGVPEGGSSLSLLALASAALFGLAKLRRLCPA